jgi:hypothetical protein
MLLYLDFNVPYRKKGSWKIELMNYDHFTYAIVLMYELEIIDGMSFAYHNLINFRMPFMQN